MFDGNVLHSLDVDHIVDVSVLVNGGGRNGDDFAVSGGDRHDRILHGLPPNGGV